MLTNMPNLPLMNTPNDPCTLTLAASAFAHPDFKLTASLTEDRRSSSSISFDCMSSAAFSSFEESGITSNRDRRRHMGLKDGNPYSNEYTNQTFNWYSVEGNDS